MNASLFSQDEIACTSPEDTRQHNDELSDEAAQHL